MNYSTPPELPEVKPKNSRFYQPSAEIELNRLVYNRRLITFCFIFSIFIHVSFFSVIIWQQIRKTEREERLKMGVTIDLIVKKRPIVSRKFSSGYIMKVRRRSRRPIMGKVPSVLYSPLIGDIDVVSALDSMSFTGDLLLLPLAS